MSNGKLTRALLAHLDHQPLYLIDVTLAQLEASRNKLGPARRSQLLPVRMNAESLSFQDSAFSTVLIFFLMHEMPATARQNTLAETLRVLQPGERLIIAAIND